MGKRVDILMAAFSTRPVNEVLTYTELGALLGYDPVQERHKIHRRIGQTRKPLALEHQRHLDVAPGVGYYVVDPKGQTDLVRKGMRRTRRGLVRIERTAIHRDPDIWKVATPEQAHRMDAEAAGVIAMRVALESQEIKTAKLAKLYSIPNPPKVV